MLIVDARESESLDRALKIFKKKFEKTGTVKAFTAARRKEKSTGDRCKDRYVPL